MPGAPDLRSEKRKLLDEQIAAEPTLPFPALPPDAKHEPVERHLRKQMKRPLALIGVVENGLVRLLDPTIKLPDQSRVIVVASEPLEKLT